MAWINGDHVTCRHSLMDFETMAFVVTVGDFDEGVSIDARRLSKNNDTHGGRQLVALEFHALLRLALAGCEFIVVPRANCVDFIRLAYPFGLSVWLICLARGAPRVRHS